MKNLGPADAAAVPVGRVNGDPKSVVPVSDALFDVYRRFYAYDRSPLNARVDSVDESVPEWRKETVSFDAAYGGERVPAYLFLPKNAKPPYQAVVFFPSGYATAVPSSRYLDLRAFDFIIRSGRALLYPRLQGTFERREDWPTGPSARRDVDVQRAKDFFRAVDYLADAQGHRHRSTRLLQPQHGRVLRAHPGVARAAGQGGRVRGGRTVVRRPARGAAGQLRAAREGAGAARQRARGLPNPLGPSAGSSS